MRRVPSDIDGDVRPALHSAAIFFFAWCVFIYMTGQAPPPSALAAPLYLLTPLTVKIAGIMNLNYSLYLMRRHGCIFSLMWLVGVLSRIGIVRPGS